MDSPRRPRIIMLVARKNQLNLVQVRIYFNVRTFFLFSEKAKRKKQATIGGKQEITYKRVYIWEVEDLYGDDFNHQLLYNTDLKKLVEQILTVCFQLNTADVNLFNES